MTLQTIKSLDGKDEYVLLPITVYQSLQNEIAQALAKPRTLAEEDAYLPFVLEDYIDNPVALARMQADATQKERVSAAAHEGFGSPKYHPFRMPGWS
ncbi:MAG: hypothetical protein KKG92_14285 [Gammaproteobacteria bacterium]|nr:hypothetical protein [Gammaproteobacteria bacterium]